LNGLADNGFSQRQLPFKCLHEFRGTLHNNAAKQVSFLGHAEASIRGDVVFQPDPQNHD